MVAHNYLCFPGDLTPSSGLSDTRHTHGAQTYMQAKHHIHKIKINRDRTAVNAKKTQGHWILYDFLNIPIKTQATKPMEIGLQHICELLHVNNSDKAFP